MDAEHSRGNVETRVRRRGAQVATVVARVRSAGGGRRGDGSRARGSTRETERDAETRRVRAARVGRGRRGARARQSRSRSRRARRSTPSRGPPRAAARRRRRDALHASIARGHEPRLGRRHPDASQASGIRAVVRRGARDGRDGRDGLRRPRSRPRAPLHIRRLGGRRFRRRRLVTQRFARPTLASRAFVIRAPLRRFASASPRLRARSRHTPPRARVMVLEATILCLDNSEHVRNSDYAPSRLQVRAPRRARRFSRAQIAQRPRRRPTTDDARDATTDARRAIAGRGGRIEPARRGEDAEQPRERGRRAVAGGKDAARAHDADAGPGRGAQLGARGEDRGRDQRLRRRPGGALGAETQTE